MGRVQKTATSIVFDEIRGDKYIVEKYRAFVNGDFPTRPDSGAVK